jgi:hypothetical protein
VKSCGRSPCDRFIAFAWQRFPGFQAINATVEITNVVARQAVAPNEGLEPLRALKLAQEILAADISSCFIRRKASLELAALHSSKPRIHETRQRFMHLRLLLIDGREEVFQFNLEHTCKVKELKVADPDEPRFDLRDCTARYVPAGKLQFDRQHILRPTLLIPQPPYLRADQV